MILEDIRFYRPLTISDALSAFAEAKDEGLEPYFYGGGTELAALSRDGKVKPGAFIDLKRIPETTGISRGDGAIRFGSSVTLTQLSDDQTIPLVAAAARPIADRTIRNSITLGGNVAGMLPYREAVLPFLILDGKFEVASAEGTKTVPALEIFDKRIRLSPGEFLVAALLPEESAGVRWFYRRREKDARVDYPLVTLCGVKFGDEIRFAVSGAFSAPVRFAIPAAGATPAAAIGSGESLGLKYRTDMRGSGTYRKAMLTLAIEEALAALA